MDFWQLVWILIAIAIAVATGREVLNFIRNAHEVLDLPPYPDSDFCGRCHEHTVFEFDEDEDDWISVCCAVRAVSMDEPIFYGKNRVGHSDE